MSATSVATIKPKTLSGRMAERFGVDPQEMMATLKATAFKGTVTDAQMQALMIVADQYGLNPWTKEIYAFPDKGGIVPVVGVDGWARIINENPAFDGMEFSMDKDGTECTCKIYRKDRGHAISATEYMAECKRGTQPWQSHPRRMLRHKAMIQCARLAFGFAGIYDQDEAERIVTNDAPAPSVDAGPAIETIRNAQSMEELQAAFTAAWKDIPSERAALTKVKDERKKELSEPVDADFEEVPNATGE